MEGIQLILFLAVVGGLIAYIGDKLGTRIGKRKMSLWGLRPKHTSILVTIITGVLIAAFSLVVLTVASKDVRTALFGMEALKSQLSELKTAVADKNQELTQSHLLLEAKSKEYSELTLKIADTAEKLKKVQQEYESVAADRDKISALLASAERDLNAARQDVVNLQATKADLENRIASLSENRNALQQDLERLQEVASRLQAGLQNVREGVVLFRSGEVLATAILPVKENEGKFTDALMEIISKTNKDLLIRLGLAEKNMDVLWVPHREVEAAAHWLAGKKESMVVRIVSAGNVVYGEPVVGGIEMYPNLLLYSQGTSVYTEVVTVPDNGPEAERVVMEYLRRVNEAAVAKGILFDPVRGNVGTIGVSELYDVITKLRRQTGKVELTAVTKQDIYTEGPLLIEIRVRSLLP